MIPSPVKMIAEATETFTRLTRARSKDSGILLLGLLDNRMAPRHPGVTPNMTSPLATEPNHDTIDHQVGMIMTDPEKESKESSNVTKEQGDTQMPEPS